jgi:outer membrane protein assembly factor BamA
VEAGARFGRVKTVPQAALSLPEANDSVSLLFAGVTLDTLDDLRWPRGGGRLFAEGEWNLEGMGASHPYWRLRFEGRLGRPIGGKGAFQLDGLVGLSGDELQVYDYFRVGGPALIPGYRHEELKGAQALAAAVSLRYPVLGQLQLVARGGAGNVFADRQDIGSREVRWGAGIGVYYPSPIGPVSLELGVRDSGKSLVSLVVGWY